MIISTPENLMKQFESEEAMVKQCGTLCAIVVDDVANIYDDEETLEHLTKLYKRIRLSHQAPGKLFC